MSGPTLPVPMPKGDAAWPGGKKPVASGGEAPAFQALLEKAGLSMPPALGPAGEEEGLQRPRLGALLGGASWPSGRESDEAPPPETGAEVSGEAGAAEVLEADGEAALAARLAEKLVEALRATEKPGASAAARGTDAPAPATPSPRRPGPRPPLEPGTGERIASPAGPTRTPAADARVAVAPRVTHRETHFAPSPQRPVETADNTVGPQPRAASADPGILSRRPGAAESERPRAVEATPTGKVAAEPAAVKEPAPPGPANAAPALPPVPAERSGEGRVIAELQRAVHAQPVQDDAQPGGGPVKALHLQLKPEHLGELTVKMRLTDAGLEVHIEATRVETVALLKNDREAIASLLKASGYAAEAVTVAMADRTSVLPQQGAAPEGSSRQADAQAGSGGADDRGGRSEGRSASHPGGRGNSGGLQDEQDQERRAARRPDDLYL